MEVKILIILIVLALVSLSQNKKITRQVKLTEIAQKKRIFITHFDFGIGISNITIRHRKLNGVDNNQLTYLKVGLLRDDQLSQYKEAQTCRQKQQVYKEYSRLRFFQSLSASQFLRIQQTERQQLWYIYIYNCDKFEIKSGEQAIIFEFTIFNVGSHFGEDEGYFWPYLLLFLLWISFLGSKLFLPMFKSAMKLNTNTSEMFLYAGYFILGLSIFYKLVNIITEEYTGQKLVVFDILHGMFKNFAEGVMLCILLAIGWGWTITGSKIPLSVKISSIGFAIANTTSVVLWHLREETEDTYHQFEELPGIIVFVLRVSVGIFFIFGCASSQTELMGKRKLFFNKFMVLGSIYLFSWPGAVIISQILLPPYLHNEFILGVEEYVHLIANAYICRLFTDKDSDYQIINLKKNDGDSILPTRTYRNSYH